ncbi:MAG TPA: response regulator transcription factor [Terriglobales bacterium]|jgi:DNA-binding NarL/FixJ family response regulator|nr:response regulator transcription factor [Terriglobales bacterium]
MSLRILVADDHDVIRQGVISLIKADLGWEVCAEASDGRAAVDKAKELKPDIVIIDIGMPLLNGLDATRQIIKENARVKVLILTMADGDRVVRDAFEAGAQGFVLKSDASRDLVAAIHALGHGNTFFTARVSRIVLSGYLEHIQSTKNEQIAPTLTPREREVIQLVAEGESSKQVAARLGISPKTAETHRNNVMQKLNLHSMVELVLFAVRNGIIQVAIREPDSLVGAQTGQSNAA